MDLSRIRLIALDMDGTLTQHRTPLEAQNKKALDALGARFRLVLIGAGSCDRIHRQLNGYPMDVIGNYGMETGLYQPESGEMRVEESLRSEPVGREEVSARIARLRAEFGMLSWRGEPVEFHASGMLTFALLGTKAEIADKLAFDPDRRLRRPLLPRVRETFPEYTVFLGGSSSFDIVPKPFNKLYALEKHLSRLGLERDQAAFFGDDYLPGGNDEQVYASDIAFIPVDDYRRFPTIAAEFMNRRRG